MLTFMLCFFHADETIVIKEVILIVYEIIVVDPLMIFPPFTEIYVEEICIITVIEGCPGPPGPPYRPLDPNEDPFIMMNMARRRLQDTPPDTSSSTEPECGAPGGQPCFVRYPSGVVEASCFALHIPMSVCEPPPPEFNEDCFGGIADGSVCVYQIRILEETPVTES